MARKISFIVTNDFSINAVAGGKSYAIGKDHPNYQAIKDAVNADDVAALAKLADIPKAVTSFAKGKVEVKDGVVFFSGKPIHNGVTERILALMREKFHFEPMLRFLENLMQNESYRAVKELYDFLAHRALPITDDGFFLGYKRVRDDWTDLHSGTFDNSIGNVVEMVRNQVDDNREVGCSEGLHVGSIEYVSGFGYGGHVIIVKVNPKDVVSVPSEDSNKLRCCKYAVIGEYEGDLTAPLYTSSGVPANPADYQDEHDDDDFDEDEEDDDEDDDFEDDLDDDDAPVPPTVPVESPEGLFPDASKNISPDFGFTASGETKPGV